MTHDFHFALWLLREARGMTQVELAEAIDRPRQLVSDWEISQLPTIESLHLVARGLRVPVRVICQVAEGRKAA